MYFFFRTDRSLVFAYMLLYENKIHRTKLSIMCRQNFSSEIKKILIMKKVINLTISTDKNDASEVLVIFFVLFQ